MTNHSIINEAFQSLREPLAGYILQQLMSIPEYKRDDQWWLDGVVRVLSEFNARDAEKLSFGTDFADRQDSMDITACLNLIDLHWPNLFKYRLPANARSWCKEIKNTRNTWAHFTGTDFTDKETERALDTITCTGSSPAIPSIRKSLTVSMRTGRPSSIFRKPVVSCA